MQSEYFGVHMADTVLQDRGALNTVARLPHSFNLVKYILNLRFKHEIGSLYRAGIIRDNGRFHAIP